MLMKSTSVMPQVFFNEKMLRKRFKIDQPHSLRVRTYIIRGLNVSGALWQRLERMFLLPPSPSQDLGI